MKQLNEEQLASINGGCSEYAGLECLGGALIGTLIGGWFGLAVGIASCIDLATCD